MVGPAGFWQDKRVFVTGHTGFKGSWLCLWLKSKGAEVFGFALEPPTQPNMFTVARVADGMAMNVSGDIRDQTKVAAAMRDALPDIVFHLAAQSLVRCSYDDPARTFATNVMGTVNVLEAVRASKSVRAVINVTSDKCYENREWLWAYRENESLGGYDPYSSSKACSELLTAAYRRSFMNDAQVALASARSGNVIGGGDWATDRLVPDVLRAVDRNEPVKVRSPDAIRPWQHVLEPLLGYLMLAEQLCTRGAEYAEAWNFGPRDAELRSVKWLVERVCEAHPQVKWEQAEGAQPHEAAYLKLDSSKAHVRLNWKQRWSLETALARTLEWHEGWRHGNDMRALTFAQLAEYEQSPFLM